MPNVCSGAKNKYQPPANVFRRSSFPGALTITQQPYIAPAADGTLTLLAQDADPHGATGGNVRIAGSGVGSYLTDWTRPQYRVEYHVKTGKPGKWSVQAEVAAPKAAKLNLTIGKASLTADIPATSSDWKTISIGTIELPAEEAVLVLKPVRKDWNPIELRTLTLTLTPVP